MLHPYVLLFLAGVLVQLTLVAVVFPITATHRLLRLALAAEGAHAFSRQAVWWLDTGAAVATGHLSAGVFQSCREGGNTSKQHLLKIWGAVTLKSTPVNFSRMLQSAGVHLSASNITRGCWCTKKKQNKKKQVYSKFGGTLDTAGWRQTATAACSSTVCFILRQSELN